MAVLKKFQSTHPCGVRPTPVCKIAGRFYFNPRTHVGCDPCALLNVSTPYNFNPRTHVGCDTLSFSQLITTLISIHAPMWGATLDRYRKWLNSRLFQSTHPCGVRRSVGGVKFTARTISIHAPMWGATYFLSLNPKRIRFQSTHPCGVRLKKHDKTLRGQYISIHAPMWGATYVQ